MCQLVHVHTYASVAACGMSRTPYVWFTFGERQFAPDAVIVRTFDLFCLLAKHHNSTSRGLEPQTLYLVRTVEVIRQYKY